MLDLVESIRHQAAIDREIPERVDRRQAKLRSLFDERDSTVDDARMRQKNQAAVRRGGKFVDATHDVIALPDADGGNLEAERRRDGFNGAQELGLHRRVEVHDHPGSRDRGRNLLQQAEPFAADRRLEILKAGDVAVRVRKTADKSASQGIGDLDEHGRYALVQLDPGGQRHVAADHDDIRSGPDQRSYFRADPVDLGVRPAHLDADVAPLAPAKLVERVAERGDARLSLGVALPKTRRQHADAAELVGLCARSKRPGAQNAECGQKSPPCKTRCHSTSLRVRHGRRRSRRYAGDDIKFQAAGLPQAQPLHVLLGQGGIS